MNSTIVDSSLISKIKRTNNAIRSIEAMYDMFGILTPKQELMLTLKKDKLNKLIDKLR